MKGRAILLFALLAFAVPAAPIHAQKSTADRSRFIARIESTDAAQLARKLTDADYDVLAADAHGVDLVVTSAEARTLEAMGHRVEIVDRTRPLYEALSPSARKTDTRAMTLDAAAALAPATYQDLDGIVGRLHDIAAAHPAIATVVDITAAYGTPATSEGRHLFALKISDNVATDEDEPAMLIVSTHHAREISTPLITLGAAERLTSGYGLDPRITAAVDGHEIWIAPVWNPDGYAYVFSADNMWRKNRRAFSNGVGVDQNRNYTQGWSSSCAGSTSAGSETYKGPSAASEPETRTMMEWSRRERFAKVLDYHSYGREVLYGYRCLGHPFTAWMQKEAAALSIASGYGGHTRLPSAEGEHPEWQFAQMGAYAFLIETHTQFQPSYASAISEASLVWPGILSVLERPVPVSGHVIDATTGLPLAARVDLVNVAFSNGEGNSSGGPYGAYHLFVPPGTYDVRFSAPGYAPVTQSVTVTSTSAEVLDIQLQPAGPEPPEQVLFDDNFEADLGWVRNPGGTDTATSGRWERADPQSTSSAGPKQLGAATSGLRDLVTGRLAGTSAGSYDLDGGRTSIQSPAIAIPTGETTLSFNFYFAHGTNASTDDYLRMFIVTPAGRTVVFQERGDGTDDDAAWASASVDLSAFAGQTVRILIEAADAGTASLVEAAIDDVKVVSR